MIHLGTLCQVGILSTKMSSNIKYINEQNWIIA